MTEELQQVTDDAFNWISESVVEEEDSGNLDSFFENVDIPEEASGDDSVEIEEVSVVLEVSPEVQQIPEFEETSEVIEEAPEVIEEAPEVIEAPVVIEEVPE